MHLEKKTMFCWGLLKRYFKIYHEFWILSFETPCLDSFVCLLPNSSLKIWSKCLRNWIIKRFYSFLMLKLGNKIWKLIPCQKVHFWEALSRDIAYFLFQAWLASLLCLRSHNFYFSDTNALSKYPQISEQVQTCFQIFGRYFTSCVHFLTSFQIQFSKQECRIV